VEKFGALIGMLINNFRSLKQVTLTDLDNLTILIGANSSGKSNILEAFYLFFNEFDPAPQRNIGSVSEYLWYDRDDRSPILFEITLVPTFRT
jgi:predicted ATP-dependent endonuclease of OLD family